MQRGSAGQRETEERRDCRNKRGTNRQWKDKHSTHLNYLFVIPLMLERHWLTTVIGPKK